MEVEGRGGESVSVRATATGVAGVAGVAGGVAGDGSPNSACVHYIYVLVTSTHYVLTHAYVTYYYMLTVHTYSYPNKVILYCDKLKKYIFKCIKALEYVCTVEYQNIHATQQDFYFVIKYNLIIRYQSTRRLTFQLKSLPIDLPAISIYLFLFEDETKHVKTHFYIAIYGKPSPHVRCNSDDCRVLFIV